MSQLGRVLSKVEQLTRTTDVAKEPLGDFSKKKSYFYAIWIKLLTFLEPFETTKLQRFESQLKN